MTLPQKPAFRPLPFGEALERFMAVKPKDLPKKSGNPKKKKAKRKP